MTLKEKKTTVFDSGDLIFTSRIPHEMENQEGDTFAMEDEENAFKILIATDIHLGFMEKHPVRGKNALFPL